MKTNQVFMVLVALATLVGVAGAQFDGALSMVNVTVSPSPVIAGGNVTINFRLYDAYSIYLFGTTLQPSAPYPLFNQTPLSGKILGQVNPGVDPTNYSYTFPIPSTLQSGTYTITFNASYFVYGGAGTELATSKMPVTFFVQNNPAIKVTAATSASQPATLSTGHNQSIILSIQNIGYGTARNVSVSVAAGDGLNLLSPVTTFFISNMTQGTTITEPLLVGAQSLNNTYLVANMSFYSSRFQQRFKNTQKINLTVAPSAQFTVVQNGPGPSIGATDVPVSFKVTNTGSSAASQIQFTLETTYPITPVAGTAYVNNLQAGQSTNMTFLVDVDTAGVSGSYPVTLYEQWKQPNGAVNQQFSGSSNYFVPVVGSGTSGLIIDAAAVVIIVIVAVVIYKRRAQDQTKKGRKKET